jgi:hypothetical protein
MQVISIITNFTYKFKGLGGINPIEYKEIIIGIAEEICKTI